MKYFVIAFFLSAFSVSSTFSQFALVKKFRAGTSFTYGDIQANPLKDGSLIEARVSQLALISFRNSFDNVISSKWYRNGNGYLVCYKKNENVSRALFDAKGNLIYSYFYGFEKDLPAGVKELVKANYPGYDIILAIEVYQYDRKMWVVNLDNERSLVSVSVENGSLQKNKSVQKININ